MAGSVDGVRPARLDASAGDARAFVRHVHAGQARTVALAHAASLSKLRGHHADLCYLGAWRYREWQGMWFCTRLDGRPGPWLLQAVPLTYR
jgi:hypothetical protein